MRGSLGVREWATAIIQAAGASDFESEDSGHIFKAETTAFLDRSAMGYERKELRTCL